MSVIGLKRANCKNCYKCLRVCPVKSITFKDDRAEIMPEECILCGHCLEACPQNAKTLHSDLDKVLTFLASDAKVIVSLAPSFIGSFTFKRPAQLVTALKKLGFDAVAETAEGASMVTDEYCRLLQTEQYQTAITTCCPTVNNLIEKYYPELIPYMLPSITPMIAPGRLLKSRFGPATKVVFLGPCIAKIEEANDVMHANDVDAVLTFDEVANWLEKEGIVVSELEDSPFEDAQPGINRMYPITDGIIASLEQRGALEWRKVISIYGTDRCIDLFKALKAGELEPCLIEANACKGGCVYGPAVHGNRTRRFQATLDIRDYMQENGREFPKIEADVEMHKAFIDKTKKNDIPDEATIRSILASIGKDTPDKEQNCGFCGYPSCRDKAIAVYQKKAKLYMCLPYMSEMTKSLSNVILAETPNIIIAVDTDMVIQEMNLAAEKAFKTKRYLGIGRYLYEFIDTSYFELVAQTHENITDKRVEYPQYGIVTLQNITYVPDQKIIIGIFNDITDEVEQQDKMYKLRVDTVDMAQKVIDNQMRVAQQIASLLGETTAETKVTLTKLKDMIVYDDDEMGS